MQTKVYHLFANRFLSTWNARSYEFSSTLFVAYAFPEGLAAASWAGISVSLAVIMFASSIGRWVDYSPSRLRTLLTTISVNRTVIIVSCSLWLMIVGNEAPGTDSPAGSDSGLSDSHSTKSSGMKGAIYIIIIGLGVLERLSRLANFFSVERDWVPTLAMPESDIGHKSDFDLSHLNAVMSRIDLVCKLISPIAMSRFMSATGNPRFTAAALVGLNLATWPLEYWTARVVWFANDQLRVPKSGRDSSNPSAAGSWDARWSFSMNRLHLGEKFREVYSWCVDYVFCLKAYFSTEVWIPSITMSSLHFSVMVFSGILTVFLVQSGFSVTLIMWGEVLSAVFELSSTFVFSFGIRRLSMQSAYMPLSGLSNGAASPPMSLAEDSDEDEATDTVDQSVGASRLGLLGLISTLVSLIPAVPAIWQLSLLKRSGESTNSNIIRDQFGSIWSTHAFAVICIILFISASRLGRWTNVLSTQQLAQSCVQANQRSMFAGTEASLSSLFGLGHWLVTAIWSRHEAFRWAAVASVAVVAGSTSVYALWLWRRGK